MENRLSHPPTQPFQGVSTQPPSHSPSSSLPLSHPPTAQPPVQIPFSDPFHTRDPFLPSTTQRSRRGSYGVVTAGAPVTAAHERAWTTQAQPSGTTTIPFCVRVGQACRVEQEGHVINQEWIGFTAAMTPWMGRVQQPRDRALQSVDLAGACA